MQQENNVKGQLLDHVLHNEFNIFSKELITSVSSTNTNDTSSNNSSRSSSPIDFSYVFNVSNKNYVNISICLCRTSLNVPLSETWRNTQKSKIRRRTTQPSEMLFGTSNQTNMSQSEDSSTLKLDYSYLQKVPSVPGSLKLVNQN